MAHTHALCTDGKPPRLVALVYASGLRLIVFPVDKFVYSYAYDTQDCNCTD